MTTDIPSFLTMSSLDRLLDLARRTGDRLIVHDPLEDKDMVIMDVDSYEHLMLGRKQTRELSERQMLDQINRDIAIWRAHQETEEFGSRTGALEDELTEYPPFDPFEEDIAHKKDWHTAGSVLGAQYADTPWLADEEGEEVEEEDDIPFVPRQVSHMPEHISSVFGGHAPLSSEPAPQPVKYEPNNTPLGETEPVATSEEPVFYEEPV